LFCISRSEANVGLAATLNRLIALRTDEVFLFRMDADDLCLPGRFERQLEHMNKHPDVDILGTAIIEHLVDSGARRVVHFAAGPEDARRGIAKRVPVAHPTVCFRSSVFDRVGGYPLVTGNEDIAMWFRCLQADQRFDNLADPLLEYTVSQAFWKRRSLKKAWSELCCYVAGLLALEGWSWRLAYPFARFAFRLAPSPVVQRLYSSRRLRG
jgi:glycosyltransferase involved in cell wall biosynthesis